MIRLRRLSDVRATGDLVWFQRALDRLRALRHDVDPRLQGFFSDASPLYIARAPGRLDVMGVIAAYSGARVLELPLECSTAALLQRQATACCDLTTRRPGGGEARGRRAVWDHGSDTHRLRPPRPAPPVALPAGHDRGIPRDPGRLSVLRHRFRGQPRGRGSRL